METYIITGWSSIGPHRVHRYSEGVANIMPIEFHRVALLCCFILVAITGLIAVSSLGESFNIDLERTGIYENARWDLWGNLTVPQNGTLDLRNVTITFHQDANGPYGLRALIGSSLILTDYDDDPYTTGDRTNITSVGGPWFFVMRGASNLTTSGAELSNVGLDYTDPNLGRVRTIELMVGAIDLTDASITNVETDVIVDTGSFRLNGTKMLMQDRWVIVDSSLFVLELSSVSVYELSSNCSYLSIVDSKFTCDFVASIRKPKVTHISNSTFKVKNFSVYGTMSSCAVYDSTFEGPNGGSVSFNLNNDSYPSAEFVNLTFTGFSGALYTRYARALIDRCRFSDCTQGLSFRQARVLVKESTFWNIAQGIGFTDAQLDIDNSSFDDCDMGIYFNYAFESLEIDNCTFSGGRGGVKGYRLDGGGNVSHCRFENQEMAFYVDRTSSLNFSHSVFNNSTTCIELRPYLESPYRIKLLMNTFLGFTQGVLFWGDNVTLVNNHFEDNEMGDDSCGVRLIPPWHEMESEILIQGNYIRNCSKGILLTCAAIPHPPRAMIEYNVYENCGVGLSATNLSQCVIRGSKVIGGTLGMDLTRIGSLVITNVNITDVKDGMTILNCTQVIMEDGILTNITDWAVREDNIIDAQWNITNDMKIEGCRLAVSGVVRIHGSIHLERSKVQFSNHSGSPNMIIVFQGGNLVLKDSTITGGFVAAPLCVQVRNGGGIEIANTTILRCGIPYTGDEHSGIYIEGGRHNISGLSMRDGYGGLVLFQTSLDLVNSEIDSIYASLRATSSDVTVHGSMFNSSDKGIYGEGSNLSFDGCIINGSQFGVQMKDCALSINNSSISSWLVWMDLQTVNATLDALRSTSNAIFRAADSHVVMTNMDISARPVPGSISSNTTVRLFDTLCQKGWRIFDAGSIVETYWSHEISAIYQWNGKYALGERIYIDCHNEPILASSFIYGDNGTIELKWLSEGIEINDGFVQHAPYTFSVDDGGLFAKASSNGNASWKGRLVLKDVSPPSVIFINPVNGSAFNSSTFSFEGIASDLGSGLKDMRYSLDSVLWETIDHEDGAWSIEMEVGEGLGRLIIKVQDLANNTHLEGIEFRVDETAPMVGFSSPVDGVTLANTSVSLTGFVLFGEGSPIQRCSINVTGYFNFTVVLPHDGVNEFELEGYDMAGNVGKAYVTIIRDVTPPILVLDPYPELTNDREVVVSGTCIDANIVTVLMDDFHVATVTTEPFQVSLELEEGWNEFKLVGNDSIGNSVEVILGMTLDTRIEGRIVYPEDNSMIEGGAVVIRVDTDPFNLVRVQEYSNWLVAPENGLIEFRLDLEPGKEYSLVVEFRDGAGNTCNRTVTFTTTRPDQGPFGITLITLVVLSGAVILFGTIIVLILVKRRRLGD